MKSWKIDSVEILYQGWATLSAFFLSDPDQDLIIRREVFDSGDGVAAFLYNPEKKKIMLTKQFRVAAFANGHADGYLLETCAGLVDDLDAEEAIIKEIWEETGIKTHEVNYLFDVFVTPGAHKEKLSLYTCVYNDSMRIGEGGGVEEENEEIEIIEISYNEAIELLSSGKIQDAKTVILLQYAIQKGLLQ